MCKSLFQHIYRHPLITSKDIDEIYDAHQKVHYKKGDYILKEGQVANEFSIMQNGLIRSFVHDYDGNDITTNFYTDEEIVIEVSSLFLRVPTRENMQALTDCVCWRIGFDVFQKLFHSIEGYSEWGRAWMSNQLFHCKQRSVSIITDSATDRYLSLLKEKPQILQQAPLKQIATYLGITDTSLSRIRKSVAAHTT